MFKKSLYTLISVIFVLTLALGPMVSISLAKQPSLKLLQPLLENMGTEDSKCWPLDVFVVIDQSYSMFQNSNNPASDPNGYRFQAAQEVLTELILNRQEKCQEAIHRFSLITFGSQAIRHLPLIQIDLDENAKSDEWAAEYFKKIHDAELDRSQNRTDFFTAFDEISAIYKETAPVTDPADYGPRKKILIVITDGNPTDVQNKGLSNEKDYMCKLKSGLNDTAMWDDFHIWVVALNAGYPYLDEKGCKSTMRQDWIDITSAHQGELFSLAYNDQAIPAFVNDVVSKEFGSPGKRMACNEIFYIDPYTQRVEFLFFRRQDEKNFVTISKLDNVTLESVYQLKSGKQLISDAQTGDMTLAGYDVSANGGKESYVLENPLPGAWRFNIEGVSAKQCQRNIEARNISFSAEVKVPQANAILPRVEASPYYDISNKNFFQVLLKNSSTGKSVSNNSEYSLDVVLTWKLPSGKKSLPNGAIIAPVKLSPGPRGTWVSSEPALTPELGEYTYIITGTAPSGDKASKITIFSISGKYDAKDILPLNFAISSPTKDQPLSCNQFLNSKSINNSLPLSIQLIDKSKAPISAEGIILSEMDESFVADIYDSTGKKQDSIPLKAEENGVFKGELLSNQAVPVACGDAIVKVSFIGSVDVEKYSIGRAEESIEIQRAESVGVVARFLTPEQSNSIQRFSKIMDACSTKKINLIPVKIELTNLKNGDRLAPADILLDPALFLYQVELSGPKGKESSSLKIAEDGSLYLTTNVGAEITDTGQYTLKLLPNPQTFKPGFTPVGDALEVGFSRADSLWNSPVSCQIASVSGWLALALLIGFLVFIFTGGPGGRIEFQDSSGQQILSVRLSTMRLFTWFKVKKPALAGMGIKYMQYWRGSSASTDSRSVLLKIVDVNDEAILYSDVETGYPLPLTTDVNVEYFHPKVSNNSPQQF